MAYDYMVFLDRLHVRNSFPLERKKPVNVNADEAFPFFF